MSSKSLGISFALAAALAAPGAQAILLNTEAFREAGGDPNNVAATYAQATHFRWIRSLQAPFDGVGAVTDNGLCTGTWLGNDERHAWILTAKHCADHELANWVFSAPTVSVAGVARRYLPPGHGSGIAWDIALLAIPLGVPSTHWNAITKPLLYDGDAEIGRTTHLVGQGRRGVGQTNTSLGRMWGTTRVVGAFASNTGLVAGYHGTGKTDLQVRNAPGDSGSAWWQQHAGGYWAIVAVASTITSGGGNGTRVNRHVDWIKGVFPGASLFSERFTVTEKQPFVSRNHADDINTAVYYVLSSGQPRVNGPTFGIRGPHHLGTHSTIRVTAKDAITGAERPIVLRGSRDSGCGDVEMSNAVSCGWMKMGPLRFAYHAEDNVGLPSGEWKARFDVDARGWHHTYKERLPISVDIRNFVQGKVLRDIAWQSPNFAEAASRGTVYYVVPPQTRATGPTSPIWSGQQTHSTLRVLAREASTGFERYIALRATRFSGCGFVRMEDGASCLDRRMGPLRVTFHSLDNPDLPAGTWRGVAYLRAKGWHDPALDEAIRLDVAIDR